MFCEEDHPCSEPVSRRNDTQKIKASIKIKTAAANIQQYKDYLPKQQGKGVFYFAEPYMLKNKFIYIQNNQVQHLQPLNKMISS